MVDKKKIIRQCKINKFLAFIPFLFLVVGVLLWNYLSKTAGLLVLFGGVAFGLLSILVIVKTEKRFGNDAEKRVNEKI